MYLGRASIRTFTFESAYFVVLPVIYYIFYLFLRVYVMNNATDKHDRLEIEMCAISVHLDILL